VRNGVFAFYCNIRIEEQVSAQAPCAQYHEVVNAVYRLPFALRKAIVCTEEYHALSWVALYESGLAASKEGSNLV
jgi:hypothetical protein